MKEKIIFFLNNVRPKSHWNHPLMRMICDNPPKGCTFKDVKDYSAHISQEDYCRKVKILLSDMEGTGIYIEEFKRYCFHEKTICEQIEMYVSEDSVILTNSFPYVLLGEKFIIEIESVEMLFWPFLKRDYAETPDNTKIDYKKHFIYPIVKYLLDSDKCLGIVTHYKSTVNCVKNLFADDIINKKCFYIPLGINSRKCDLLSHSNHTFNFIFTSSWGNWGFVNRGGYETCNAFNRLCEEYENIRLIMKIAGNETEMKYVRSSLYSEKIRIINSTLSTSEYEALLRNADAYVLPSHDMHVLSILECMSYGIPLICSDLFPDYLRDSKNSLLIDGYNECTQWIGNDGTMRWRQLSEEEYLIQTDKVYRAMKLIYEDDALRNTIVANALEEVRTRFSLESWNVSLENVFDLIYA